MKKILSLALVLVMVIGMMPAALADTVTCDGTNHTFQAAGTGTVKTPATCTTDGVEELKCTGALADGSACPVVKEETIKALGHAVPENGWTETVAPTCGAAGKKTGTCAVCGETDEAVVPATGDHPGYKDGKCTVCGAAEPAPEVKPTVKLSASSTKATSGEKVTLTASFDKGSTSVELVPASWMWSGEHLSDTVVAGGASATAVFTAPDKAGEYEVTAIAKVGEETYSASAKITVSAAYIAHAAGIKVALGKSVDLDPSVVGAPKGAVITYTFTELAKGNGDIDLDDEEVTGKTAGVCAVSIGASYKNGDVKVELAPITVYVGVYDSHTVEAELKSSVSGQFTFAEEKIFSTLKYDGTKLDSDASLADALAETDGYSIEFEESVKCDDVGTWSTDAWGDQDATSMSGLSNTKLILNGKSGTFALTYSIYASSNYDNVLVATGNLTVEIDGSGTAIEYPVSYGAEVTFDEDDFEEYWDDSSYTDDLEYVKFSVNTFVPDSGELYVDDTQKTVVTSSMIFEPNYSSKSNYYDLDEVTYQANTKLKTAHEVEIPFTCYGTKGNTLEGIVLIKVGETVKFTDVKEKDYFYDAVVWAVNEGVTSGTSATTFSPSSTCTRAEVVTFLYRAAGEPRVTGSLPFTDVDKDDWYYDAVLWAYNNDITTGLTAKTFGPKATVTRGQVVTFLWRAMGEDEVTATNRFLDVKKSDYFYEAVLWAVKNDVTTGMSTTSFAPNSGCTRGQIVTFLYRAYEGE